MANGAIGEDRDIGGATADVDQTDPQFLFIFGQHGHGGGQRLQHQIGDFQPAAAHALDDILCRRHRAGDDMHLHFQPHRAHAERIANVFLAVDNELLRDGMENLLVGRDVDRTRGFHHAVHIHLADFLVLDGEHAMRVEALDVAARNAGVHLAYLAVRHQFGLFQRALDCVDRGLDIDYHAPPQTARRVRTHADDVQRAFGSYFGDDADNLGSADIEADDEVFGVSGFAHGSALVGKTRTRRHAYGKTVGITQIDIGRR